VMSVPDEHPSGEDVEPLLPVISEDEFDRIAVRSRRGSTGDYEDPSRMTSLTTETINQSP